MGAWPARLIRVLPVVGFFYLVLGAVSFWPDAFWAFEMLSNLRTLFVWAGLLLALVLLALHFRSAALLVAIAATLNAIAALTPVDPVAKAAAAAPNLRVMSINIGHDSHHGLFDSTRNNARLVEIAKAEHPDVLVLIEDLQSVRESLAARIGDYPYQFRTGSGERSLSVHSRYPLTDRRVRSTAFVEHILTCRLQAPTAHGDRKVLFIATHPTSPASGHDAYERKRALARLAQQSAEAGLPVILAGDLNLTPQSPYFARLLQTGNLRDTARGRAPAPTWMAPVVGLGLRIDHVLVSPDIAVAARRVGPGFHSDHRPLTVDLFVPDAPSR
jgi:endonuclease/exonuclease/phosphatase (EEP) superfamily protein YafD